MIDTERWLESFIPLLVKSFDARLIFVGLQGSYTRGEATETSDLDIVTILSEVNIGDLSVYRQLIRTMPHAEKACGFISGQELLQSWPSHDLFQFKMETIPYYGTLDGTLPQVTDDDIRENVRISAANLYHTASHSYNYASEDSYSDKLQAMYKMLRFAIQSFHYLQTGEYCKTKQELYNASDDSVRPLIFPESRSHQQMFEGIIQWSASTLKKLKPLS